MTTVETESAPRLVRRIDAVQLSRSPWIPASCPVPRGSS